MVLLQQLLLLEHILGRVSEEAVKNNNNNTWFRQISISLSLLKQNTETTKWKYKMDITYCCQWVFERRKHLILLDTQSAAFHRIQWSSLGLQVSRWQ